MCRSALAGPEPGLPDETGQQRHGRRLLRCAGRRRQCREGDHQHDRAVRGDNSREGEHQDDPRQVAHEQDGPAVVAVGHGAADRAEQNVGQEPADGGCADPRRRARGAVDVAQQGGVVEPVAELGSGARTDQCPRVAHLEDAAIGPPPTHGLLLRHGASASPAVVGTAAPARRARSTISDKGCDSTARSPPRKRRRHRTAPATDPVAVGPAPEARAFDPPVNASENYVRGHATRAPSTGCSSVRGDSECSAGGDDELLVVAELTGAERESLGGLSQVQATGRSGFAWCSGSIHRVSRLLTGNGLPRCGSSAWGPAGQQRARRRTA